MTRILSESGFFAIALTVIAFCIGAVSSLSLTLAGLITTVMMSVMFA